MGFLVVNIFKEVRGKSDMDIIWKMKVCLWKYFWRICKSRWKGRGVGRGGVFILIGGLRVSRIWRILLMWFYVIYELIKFGRL